MYNDELNIIFSLIFWCVIVYIIIKLVRYTKRQGQGGENHTTARQKDSALTDTNTQLNHASALSAGEAAPSKDAETSANATSIPNRRIIDHTTQLTRYAENQVDKALRAMGKSEYIVFQNLIIPARHKVLSFTQIDHVVVSTFGIFCIETKSNHGYIYGLSRAQKWKQYLASKKYDLSSPYQQNMLHVRSLEMMHSGKIRKPIHSYVSFPNAKKVTIDGKVEDMSVEGVTKKISHHVTRIYTLEEVERIAKTLAHMASLREELRARQIDDLREYIANRTEASMSLH